MTRHSTASWARSVSSVQGHSMNQLAIRPRSPPPPPSPSASFRTRSPAGSTLTDVTGYSRQAEREAPGYHGGHFAHLPGPDHFRNKPRRLGLWEVKTTLPSDFDLQESNNSHVSTSRENSAAIDKWNLQQEEMRGEQELIRRDNERQSQIASAPPSSVASRGSINPSSSVSRVLPKPPSRAPQVPYGSNLRTDARNRYAPPRG